MVVVIDLFLYLFAIKWIDLIKFQSLFLYKCIITLYLFIVLFLFQKLIPFILPLINHTFLISAMIGWIMILLVIIWFLCKSSFLNSSS